MNLFDKLFKLNTKDKIENWLYLHKIKNFIIQDDLTVNVNGDVNLKDCHLSILPIQFGIVLGSFNISDNYLKTLKGSPIEVGEDFSFDSNKIKSFKYAPQKVGKLIYAVDNPIYKIKKEEFNIQCEEIELGYIHKNKSIRKEIKALKNYYQLQGQFRHLKWFTCKLSSEEIKKLLNFC
jgi:hypothetical protein